MARMHGTPVLPQPQGCPKATPATKRDPPGHNMGYERKRDEVVLSTFATKDPSGLRRPCGHLTTLAVEDCLQSSLSLPQLKELRGDYAAGPSPELEPPHPTQLVPLHSPTREGLSHTNQSVKSGRGDPQSVKSGRGDFQPNIQMLMQATGNALQTRHSNF